MNKGLKQGLPFCVAGSEYCKRNTDLMNKGLKLILLVLREKVVFPKRNTDLMNKGLKHSTTFRC